MLSLPQTYTSFVSLSAECFQFSFQRPLVTSAPLPLCFAYSSMVESSSGSWRLLSRAGGYSIFTTVHSTAQMMTGPSISMPPSRPRRLSNSRERLFKLTFSVHSPGKTLDRSSPLPTPRPALLLRRRDDVVWPSSEIYKHCGEFSVAT